MPIDVNCPACGKISRAPDNAAGKKARCSGCGTIFRLVQSTSLRTDVAAPDDPVYRVAPEPARPARQTRIPTPERAEVYHETRSGGGAQQLVQVNVGGSERGNALAIAALVLGILAAIICWVPFLGLFAVPVGSLGLLLGIIALVMVIAADRPGVVPAGAGTALSLAAIIGAILITRTTSQRIAESLKEKPRVVAQAAPVGQPAPVPAEPEAVDFPQAARLANTQVRVVRVVRGKVPLIGDLADGEFPSRDAALSVYIEVANLDDSKKLEYLSWAGSGFGSNDTKLTDDVGNDYRVHSYGFSIKPVGSTSSGSIYPGKALGDHLVFQLPVEKASVLTLELPGRRADVDDGVFRFRIPVSAIETR